MILIFVIGYNLKKYFITHRVIGSTETKRALQTTCDDDDDDCAEHNTIIITVVNSENDKTMFVSWVSDPELVRGYRKYFGQLHTSFLRCKKPTKTSFLLCLKK